MIRVDGVRVRLDAAAQRGPEALYEAMARGEELTGLVTGVEQDEVLGECLVVSVSQAGDGVRCLIPADEVGGDGPKRLSQLIGFDVICRVLHIDRHRGVAVLSRKAVQERHAEEVWSVLLAHAERLQQLRDATRAARREAQAARQAGKEAYLAAVERVRQLEQAWREAGPQFDAVVRWALAQVAFVDIGGGVLARLPASEVAHGYVADCRALLKPGYAFAVRVLAVDPKRRRVWVSRRAMLPDPWQDVSRHYREGGIYLGTVAQVREQDILVELRPGVLVVVDRHVPAGALTAGLLPTPGTQVKVLVRKVVPEVRRMYGRLLSVLEQPS